MIATYVTVKVSTNVARTLQQQGPPTTESQELFKTTEKLGVVLEPVHPGAEDPYLAPYFMVKVPDTATAKRVIDCLQQCKEIEAVYIKPPDEMP